jgi:CheY-like chemotaxis protein
MKKSIGEISVLIIEDDREKREELVEILRDFGIELSNINYTKYAEEGIELLNNELPDVVLLDLNIPYSQGSESIKIDNSNKVIRAVERTNIARNLEDHSTGIIIISASVSDDGLRKNYKHIKEVVDFFDKDEIALNEFFFKASLKKKIQQIADWDFRHSGHIEFKEIRNIKLKKLESINKDLYDRITNDLLGQFGKLNNRNVNTNRVVEGIIGLAGQIVEDIISLIENKNAQLMPEDNSDNFISVRNRLTGLTGRKWNNDNKGYDLKGQSIISRKAAEYASFAYKLRSEALHTKEGDSNNQKIYNNNEYSIEDAAILIDLILPLIKDYIQYMKNK